MVRRVLDGVEVLLNAFATRVLLSTAILASLVPVEPSPGLRIGFIALFGAEALLRAVTIGGRAARREWRLGEIGLLALDVVATLSFLPAAEDVAVLRLGRVARLLLLLAYWGPLARDFFFVALQRERLSQILLVGGIVALLTGSGAAVLRVLDTEGMDSNGDGDADQQPPDFPELLWWSFRQVQDPGNLVPTTRNLGLVVVSLVLTSAGVLVISFIIGIGGSVVGDLMMAGRQRRVGLRGHMVVLNLTRENHGVIRQIAGYFAKQVRWRKVAILGAWDERPALLQPLAYRSFLYRSGRAADAASLERVDVAYSRRIAILAGGHDAASDADGVTAAVGVRRLTTRAWVVVELNRPSNIGATLLAGGHRTIPVPARRLASLVLAQELLGERRATLFQELVSLEGRELYTCVYGDGQTEGLASEIAVDVPFWAVRDRMLREHRCLLLGYFTSSGVTSDWVPDLHPVLNPGGSPARIRGLIAIGTRFEDVRRAAHDLAGGDLGPVPVALPPPHAAFVPRLRPDLRRVLVVGFHSDAVEAVVELMRIFPQCSVTIVGKDEAERHRMRHAFLSERTETGARAEVRGPKELSVCQRDGTVCGSVFLRVADRFAEGLFRPADTTEPVGNVFDYDAVIFLADTSGGADPDAGTVLGLIKTLSRWEPGRHALRSVVAEIADSDRAALIEARVRDLDHRGHVAVVCTDELRQRILTHSFFVPGLPSVLHNLLTAGEEELVELIPAEPGTRTTWAELVHTLGQASPPIVPIALILEGGTPRVNPPADTPVVFGEVRGIVCLVTTSPPGS